MTEQIARKYIPEKVRRLVHASNRLDQLQSRVKDLSEDIVLDIIEGWSTGNELLDFVLVACSGVYDASVYADYHTLYELGLKKPGQQVMVVQKAIYEDKHEGPLFLRNICLATMRPDVPTLDADTLMMMLPVEPKHIIYSEFAQCLDGEKLLLSGFKTKEEPWLPLGPLYNAYCDFEAAQKNQQRILYVPPDEAISEVELLPVRNSNVLFIKHGVDGEMLKMLRSRWLKAMSQEQMP